MRTLLAVGGVLTLAAGGVLAIGLIAGATAAADDNCPPATAPTASAQALRAGNPAAATLPTIGTGRGVPTGHRARVGAGGGTARRVVRTRRSIRGTSPPTRSSTTPTR